MPDRSPPAILIADPAAAARNDATNRRARVNVVDAANDAIEATGAQGNYEPYVSRDLRAWADSAVLD